MANLSIRKSLAQKKHFVTPMVKFQKAKFLFLQPNHVSEIQLAKNEDTNYLMSIQKIM